MARYTYSIIRFVPNLATGEFVNVGVIAGNEELHDWRVRYVSNQTRARKLGEPAAVASVFERMGALQEWCDNANDGGEDSDESTTAMTEEVLAKLYADWQHMVQLSAPAPVVAASAEEALDLLFTHVVVDSERAALGFRNKWAAVSAMLGAYRGVGAAWANNYVRQKQEVRPPRYPVQFDFVVADGHVVQLAQAWSFEIPSADRVVRDVRAWGWAVEEIRKEGAQIMMGGDTVNVPKKVDIEVVFLEPKTDAGSAAWAEASTIFKQLDVRPVNDNNATQIAERAEKLLGKAAE